MGGGPTVDRTRQGGSARRIVRIAVPLYLSMVVVSLSALVNTAALGRFDTAALAAFALTFAVYAPAVAAVSGAVRGIMPFVSARADDPDRLIQVVRNGTLLAVAVGLLGGLAVAAVPLLAQVTGVPDRTTDSLGAFPWLMAAGVLVNSIGSMATATLVGLGRSKVVLPAGLAGAGCIAVLSLVLVPGLGGIPALGLTGSGVALLVSNLVITTVTLLGLRRHLAVPLHSLLRTGFHVREVLKLAAVGIPMAGTVLVKFAVLGLLALAAAKVSTTAAAVHGIATGIVGLTFTAVVAIGQATVPLVSADAADGDRDRVHRSVRAGLAVATTALIVLCLPMVLLRPTVAGLFTSDPEVQAAAATLLPLVALSILGDGVQAVLGFGLTGLRRTLPSLLIFAALYGVLALVSFPVADRAGLSGIWTALVVANALVAIGQALAFRRTATRVVAAGPGNAVAEG